MDEYLAKPFTRCQLCSVLETVLAQPAPGEAAAASAAAPAVCAVSPDAVLDEGALAALRELQQSGRPDIVERTIALYRENAPRLVDDLKQGAETRNLVALGRASHTLKSSSANIGAVTLAVRCSELETLARDGMVAEACGLVDAVVADHAAVEAALSRRLKTAA
ncbi:MAG TPA: Hpt domain-containing protein, partial [Stellaceae bacterium]|nr:Hpt domain-containing protein [Stellaceae bacterium]